MGQRPCTTPHDRIELLKWLIDRSDTLRISYSHRATVVLTADTFMMGLLIFGADRLGWPQSAWHAVLWLLGSAAAVSAVMSLTRALKAVISLRRGRDENPFDGKLRWFVHAADTFEELDDFEDFRDALCRAELDDIVDRWCGELWVLLKRQDVRYRWLRQSVRWLLAGLWLTVAAFVAGTVARILIA